MSTKTGCGAPLSLVRRIAVPAAAAAFLLAAAIVSLCAISLRKIANTVYVNSNALSVIAKQVSQDALEEQGFVTASSLAAHIAADIEDRLLHQENYVRTLAAALTAVYSNPDMYVPRSLPVVADGAKPPDNKPFLSLAPGVELAQAQNEAYLAANCASILNVLNTLPMGIAGANIGTETGIVIALDKTNSANVRYDPRKRPWYIRAKAKNDVSWSDMYVDIRGRGISVNCAVPFYEMSSGKKTLRGVVSTST
ncbi:MAG: hypothetical protein LBG74_01975, partial [Spirochaetaceae bacterium]|nr:hypothetical protein [Spirochaetaceae bacterium]